MLAGIMPCLPAIRFCFPLHKILWKSNGGERTDYPIMWQSNVYSQLVLVWEEDLFSDLASWNLLLLQLKELGWSYVLHFPLNILKLRTLLIFYNSAQHKNQQ